MKGGLTATNLAKHNKKGGGFLLKSLTNATKLVKKVGSTAVGATKKVAKGAMRGTRKVAKGALRGTRKAAKTLKLRGGKNQPSIKH